jgi:hypothetical protein
MKTKIIITLIIVLLSFNLHAQQAWVTQLPILGRVDISKMVKTTDGGFVIYIIEIINIDSDTVSIPKIYKYDFNGNFVWVHDFVTSKGIEMRVPQGMISTSDNGFLIASQPKDLDVAYIVKYNALGEIAFEYTSPFTVAGLFSKITENLNSFTALRYFGTEDTRHPFFKFYFSDEFFI